mgnify:CR=1 FL=1
MNLDDLDMSEGATGNEIEFQFAYDALHITPILDVESEITTVREITGKDITNNGHIEPVFQAGPSASDEAGGLNEMPPTEEQSFVDQFGAAVSNAYDEASTAVSTAYNSASTSINNAFGSSDSAGGGDAT